MIVDEVMSEPVITIKANRTISEAVMELARHGISGAPVVDENGRLVGIITEKDILKAIKTKNKRLEMVYPSLSTLSVSFVEKADAKETMEAFMEIASAKVSDHMTREVVTAKKGSDLALVVEIFHKKGINRVPVMDGDKIAGIVSRADIIKGLAKSHLLN